MQRVNQARVQTQLQREAGAREDTKIAGDLAIRIQKLKDDRDRVAGIDVREWARINNEVKNLELLKARYNNQAQLGFAKLRQDERQFERTMGLKDQQLAETIRSNREQLGLEQGKLKSIDDYRKGQLANSLVELDAKMQMFAQSEETKNRGLDLQERANELRENEGLISERKVKLAEDMASYEQWAKDAQVAGDLALASGRRANANRIKMINSITEKFLSGEASGGIAEEIARSALGLKQEPKTTPAQKRLQANDLTNTELAIAELGDTDEDARLFSVYNQRFLRDAPEETNYVYTYTPSRFGANVQRIVIPKGKTLKHVREEATKRGITVEAVIDMFK